MMLTALALPMLLAAPAKPTVAFDAIKAKAGATVKATARISIPEGWHAYQNPPKSEFENPLKLKLGKTPIKASAFNYPKGVPQTFAGQETLVYEGTVPVSFRFTVPKTTKPGALRVPVQIDYQLCSSSTCLAPSDLQATLVVTVVK